MTQIADELLRARFAAMIDATDDSDWNEIVARVQLHNTPVRPLRRRGQRLFVLAAGLAALAIAVGATLAATLGGFSSWLTGSPGPAASPAEQQAFKTANAHTFAGFPGTPKLYRLTEQHIGSATYMLYGFRAGDELCLRLVASGVSGEPATSCVPRIALERAKAPAQVALVDYPFGIHDPVASHKRVPLTASASFGFVADNITRITLTSGTFMENTSVTHDAFLAIRLHPAVGSRVRKVVAIDDHGHSVPIPVAASAVGFPRPQTPGRATAGPQKVQRVVSPGSISWVIHQQPRGQTLARAGIPASRLYGAHSFGIRFARVIQPDPSNNTKIVVYLIGRRNNLCIDTESELLETGSGGCGIHFLTPLFSTLSSGFGGSQFVLLSGLASDAVAGINVYLTDGERWPVPLKDNAFAVEVPRDRLPASLIAYDKHGQVIAIAHPA